MKKPFLAVSRAFFSCLSSRPCGAAHAPRAKKLLRCAALTLMVAALPWSAAAQSLTPIWTIQPGTRNLDAAGNSRQLTYNPVSGNVLYVTRTGTTTGLIVNRVDGVTGTVFGTLNTNGISSGTIVLNSIAVADDGVIYAANVSSVAIGTAPAVKVYRWANEAAAPTVAYSGDPSGTTAVAQRWGDTITVRGAGNGTQILIGSDQAAVALLTTVDGVNFTSRRISITTPTASSYKQSLVFLPGNNFYSKTSGNLMRRTSFDPVAGTGSDLGSIASSIVPTTVAGIAVNLANNLLATVTRDNTAGSFKTNYLLDASNLAAPIYRDQKPFPTSNADSAAAQSSAAFGGGRLFTLTPNNGIMAFAITAFIIKQPSSATNPPGSSASFTVTADGTGPLTYYWRKNGNPISGANGSNYTFTVSCADGGSTYSVVVSNQWGTATSGGATLTVDTQPPSLFCPGNMSVTSSGPGGAVVNYTVTTSDNCTPNPAVNCNPPSGSNFPNGTTTVNCVATDGAGNTNGCSFTVTVTLPPISMSCPGDQFAAASGPGGATVFYAAGASGGCSPPPFFNCNPPSGSTFPVGTTFVTCTASDTCGQSSNCTFNVTVSPPPPITMNCSPNVNTTATGPGGATVFYTSSASGGCSPPPFVSCNPPSGSTFAVGTTLVNCSASDTCGQSSNCSFSVTVTLPAISISCSPDITKTASGPGGETVFYTSSASGGCSPPPFLNCNPPSGSTFPVGTTVVSCFASDGCGQSSNCTFNVTVQPPAITPGTEIFFRTNRLPPTNGMYVPPMPVPMVFPNGVVVRDAVHRDFGTDMPLPAPGVTQVHGFTSTVDMKVSLDGGFSFSPASAPAQVQVKVTGMASNASMQTFQTEMLQLDIVGGTLPPGVQLRESPTKQSSGQATVRKVAGGSMISSFFDVFPEISTDNGASWFPPQQPDPHHVVLRRDPKSVPPIKVPTDLLPPPNGSYISPAQFHILTAQGVVIKDVRHSFFTSSQPPPPDGGSQTHNFNSQVDMQLSIDGGNTFTFVRAPASVTVRVDNLGGGLLDTEMLALNLQGGDLPPGLMVRESPTEPSHGGTSIAAAPPGDPDFDLLRIGSFFDIFVEVTVDGGQNWSPASSGPAGVELTPLAPEIPKPTSNLPPLDGNYVSPAQWHALYANGIIITNASHDRFTQTQPPPVPGGSQTENFGSRVTGQISMNGGASFAPFSASANVAVQVNSRPDLDKGATRFFDTEMLSLNLSGGTLPGGVMVRESPSKPSLGKTSVRTTGADFRISSFFDIFTEVSLDGGQSWSPTVTRPGRMGLASNAAPALALTCPADVNTTASGPAGKVVTYPPATASGGCPPVSVVCNPPSGSTFPIGATTVTCVANDSCGQSATCTFKVTVTQRVAKPRWFPNPLLPPPQGEYISPQKWHQLYANGIIISNVSHRRFLQSYPPPAPGTSETHTFGSQVAGEVSMDGGQTFTPLVPMGNADVTVKVTHTGTVGGTQTYDTEMLSLTLMTTNGLKLRESPSKSSTGRTTVTPNPGGGFAIDSFFDVFTEISLDGGATWSPASDSVPMELHTDAQAVAPITAPTRLLPPPNDLYVSPQQYHILTAQGIVIRDVKHKFFTQSLPPPAPGTPPQVHHFDSQVDMELSTDGGNTFVPRRAPAAVDVQISHRATMDGVEVYDTEMLSLNIQGGDLPPGVMLRESPTRRSEGGTAIQPMADGTQRIGSFFDVFPEVSLDGGQNWSPAQGAARVELICEAPEQPAPNPNLPPLNGEYISPQKYHALYANGIIISNVSHKKFLQNQPPPPPGGSAVHNFGSQVDFQISLDGGRTFAQHRVPANVAVLVSHTADSEGTSFFNTEMLQLDISGGTLPAGVMIRESPSKASLGRTSIRQVPADGTYRIGSFFDIFTEVSLDGGASWNPAATGPAMVTLVPPQSHCIRLTCPDDIVTSATSADGNVVTYPPPSVLADFCTYTVSCSPPSGSLFPIGTTPVSCTVTSSGNDVVTCTFNIKVLPRSVTVAAETFHPLSLLPPPRSVYLPGGGSNVMYANGVIIRNLRNHFFTQSFPPPPPGAMQTHSFDSTVEFEHSMDGGNTFQKVSAPAHMSVAIGDVNGDGRTFRTEMLQLDIAGGTLPPGVMLRESPTLQSTGQTTVRPVPGGYMISSFFDVFTEISLDGNNTWSPSRGATRVEMRYDPDTVAPITVPTILLPPPSDAYVSPEQYHILTAQGIVIKDIKHSFFTGSQPPPTGDETQVHQFDSQVDMQLSTDGGNTFRPVRAPALVTVSLRIVNPGSPAIYDTEMLQLDISGGGLPAGIMVRESPTLPSRGGTQIDPQSDGSFRIGSFFDIFAEVSLDGGQNWSPAQNGPARMELRKVATPHPFPTPNLPPPNGQYISPAQWHALYANGIIISNVSHQRFTQNQPPPPPGGSQTHNFGSVVTFMLSMNGGGVWQQVTAPASVSALVRSSIDSGQTRYFDTEMLALNISGGGLPAGVMVRESPTKQSLGRTSMTPTPGGGYAIDSFFDIFTEVSVDGGQNWSAMVTSPAGMGLAPYPLAAFRINCPSNMTVTASSPSGATVNYLVTYLYPDCPFAPFTVTCTPPSGSTFPIGTTTVNCTGSDGCGEHPTCSFTVTVQQQYKILREWFFHDNLLPPLGSVYLPGGGSNVIYANGVIIRNLRNHFFTQSFPPPPPGAMQTHSFDSTVEFEHSMDGGNTFQKVSAPAHVSVAIGDVNGDGRTFRTEMLQLDIAGGTLPPGVMLRESPTLQSTGQTTVRPVSGGYMISSFFDVFTEISLDGGANWSPAADAAHVESRVDPETVEPATHPTTLLPPPEGVYISPAQFHALYAQGIVIKDVKHSFFTQSLPPPPAGEEQTHQFDSQVDLQLSTDGGQTFRSLRAPALVTVSLRAVNPGPPTMYDTEMLQLDINGGGLPAGVMIRESPTLPSRGGTQVDPTDDQTLWRIHSFFDIFTEVTLDGGQTWNPAQNGPVRMEERKVAQSHPFPTPNLPPPNGQYISPAQWHALYANGIIISNVSHQRFTQNQPPPPPGGSQTHNFGSVVTFMLSMNGGGVWQQVTAPASVAALVRSSIDSGQTRYFDTEMLALNISGGGLPAGVMVRESPSKQSLGRTSMTPTPGGGFAMDSFFDIFTEVSLDNGANWSPAITAPGTVGLAPSPFAAFTINCPSNITTTATGPGGKVVTYVVTYLYPDCPFAPFTVTCNPPSGSTFPIGTTTVNCTGSDGCGEHPTCSFTVTVNPQVVVMPPDHFFGTNTLPPPDGVYISPALYHQLYANGIIIRNIRHRAFTGGNPPPPPGAPQVHSFGSMVEVEISNDGGATYAKVSAPANVTVRVVSSGSPVFGIQTYDTEMLQLDISGSSFMIRESPTKVSAGRTDVTPGDGGFRISSFFDIFTEISLDGGANWSSAAQAAHVELRKDPATAPTVPTPGGQLPPLNGAYVSPDQYHILTAQGVVITDVSHSYFTHSDPPPTNGATATHSFDSQVDMKLSTDGGQTFTAVRAPAAVSVMVHDSGGGLFDTEMLSLNLSGGGLPPGVQLRESPTKASRGMVDRQAQPDGTFRINSFFDIFVEVSLDGGQNWSPAQSPAHVQLVDPAPEKPFPSPNLPPLDGAYVSPQQYHALYAQGIVLSNLSHLHFTQSQPPPPPGGTQTHTFNSDVQFMLSQNGGATFSPVTASAAVSVRVTSSQDEGATRFFDTEMLQLNISGGGLPGGIMVRESPTKQSLGRTSVRTTPTAYEISSFFDIFTDVSLDGGATWSPQLNSPVQMRLVKIGDVAPILINCSPNRTVNAAGAGGAVVNYTTTASGGCAPLNVVCNPPSGSTFPIGTTTVTCLANDGCGQSATCAFFITVNPPPPPPPEIYFNQAKLPPTNGMYVSPALYHQLYANGVIIKDIKHARFLSSVTPPAPGGTLTHSFDSTVEMQVSLDGGATFTKHTASAAVSTRVTSTSGPGTYRTFDTEMLALNLSGGTLPPGVMIRESPTLASTGQTTVRQVGGGYMISSFFDVFTELSLDGGANWLPAQDSTRVQLRRDPVAGNTPPQPVPGNTLPPRNGAYVSPREYHQAYAAGIIISNVSHSYFTQSLPPPPPGGSQTHQFDSKVDLMLSMNNGQSFIPVRANALCTVRLDNIGSSGQDGVFDTEMLALDISGGELQPNMRLRESPTMPSRGGVQLTQQPDGSFRVSSFFDIFTELSMDGGGTWQPATGGPAHVELQVRSVVATFPNPNLPPLTGEYVSPARFHALYAQGIVISNVSHRRFTQNQPPPNPGTSSTHSFNSDVTFDLHRPGLPVAHMTAPAAVSVRVDSTSNDAGDTRQFDTEMLSLNISGGGLPPGVMIRESPTKQSLGRTSVRQSSPPALAGGGKGGANLGNPADISSFFDIFTEVSLDGGATWNPSLTGPVSMSLQPDPLAGCSSAPSLQIVPSADGTSATISWSGSGYRVQYTENLQADAASTIWTDVPGASPVTVPIVPGHNRFYRVVCP